MIIIYPFQKITDNEIKGEIASFPEDAQKNRYQLIKKVVKDELYFGDNLEKYRGRLFQKAILG